MFNEVFNESIVRDCEAITSAGAPIASKTLDGEQPSVSLKMPSIGLTPLGGVQSTIAARGGRRLLKATADNLWKGTAFRGGPRPRGEPAPQPHGGFKCCFHGTLETDVRLYKSCPNSLKGVLKASL